MRADPTALLFALVLVACGGDDADAGPLTDTASGGPTDALCLGPAHTCVTDEDGAVFCWGENLDGQLGDGTSEQRRAPTPVPGLRGVTSLACGRTHTCAVDRQGAVRCWGANADGEIGDGTNTPRFVPTAVSELPPARAVVAGDGFSCALLRDGGVRCWGRSGRLGRHMSRPSTTPVEVEELVGAQALAAGLTHVCALGNDGTVSCWGGDSRGQLGTEGEHESSATPSVIGGLTDVRSVAAGGATTCAVTDRGALFCWGGGGRGQLQREGAGRAADADAPVRLEAPERVDAVAVGGDHVCAQLPDGAVQCWGDGRAGRLGHGAVAGSTTPVAAEGLTNVTTLAAGRAHTCAVSGRSLRCWGANSVGQVGVDRGAVATPMVAVEDLDALAGTPSEAPTIEPLTGVEATAAIHAGDSYACVLEADGRVRCWGNNAAGQLGDGTRTRRRGAAVEPLGGAVDLATGPSHACAVRANGRVYCWGSNEGRLGTGRATQSSRPVRVADVDDATQVAVGRQHTCVLRRGGAVHCFGVGRDGALGTGGRDRRDVPSDPVRDLDEVVQIAAGDAFTCARRAGGDVRCWGANRRGALGAGLDESRSLTPVEVVGLTDAVDLDARGDNACAVRANGQVRCWGARRGGALGDGRGGSGDDGASRPVTVSGLRDAARVAVGVHAACALREGGEARCWGDNRFGQAGLNDLTRTDVTRPAAVAFPEPEEGAEEAGPVTDVACGRHYCCARRGDELSCWGAGSVFPDSAGDLHPGDRVPAPRAVSLDGVSPDGAEEG